jgi:hypothetical protein
MGNLLIYEWSNIHLETAVFNFRYLHQIRLIVFANSESFRVHINHTLNEAVSNFEEAQVAHSKAPNEIVLFALVFIMHALGGFIWSQDQPRRGSQI